MSRPLFPRWTAVFWFCLGRTSNNVVLPYRCWCTVNRNLPSHKTWCRHRLAVSCSYEVAQIFLCCRPSPNAICAPHQWNVATQSYEQPPDLSTSHYRDRQGFRIRLGIFCPVLAVFLRCSFLGMSHTVVLKQWFCTAHRCGQVLKVFWRCLLLTSMVCISESEAWWSCVSRLH